MKEGETMEHMPEFNSEEEFNQYFKEQTDYCKKYRDESGTVSFKNENEFESFLKGLFSLDETKIDFSIHY